MRLLTALFCAPLLAAALLGGCASDRGGADAYARPLKLSFVDRDANTVWVQTITLGETQDDEGYPLTGEFPARICVGTGANACQHARDISVHLTLHVRSENGQPFRLDYQGEIEVLPATVLPTETRFPNGELALVIGQSRDVQLLSGLRLVVELQ